MDSLKKLMGQNFKKLLCIIVGGTLNPPFGMATESETNLRVNEPEGRIPRKSSDIKSAYFRIGKSVMSSNLNEPTLIGSLGYKKTAENVSYGLEYSYHVLNESRINDYAITAGYRYNLNRAISPYIIGGFGISTENKINKENSKVNTGLAYFYDLGLEAFNLEAGPISFFGMTGIKNSSILIPRKNEMRFTDVHFTVGVRW